MPTPSATGRYVAFHTASPLTGDTNQSDDVFVRDLVEERTTLVSAVSGTVNETALGGSGAASISADGRFVAFHSDAGNLIPGDVRQAPQVFVRDRQTNLTTRASNSSAGVKGNDASWYADISADGRFVAFQSQATNLFEGDENGHWDVFVHDLVTRQTVPISVTPAGYTGDLDSYRGGFSADNRFIAFFSTDMDLDPGPANGGRPPYRSDAFLRSDWQSPTGAVTKRFSLPTNQSPPNGHSYARRQSLSADGRFIVFDSVAGNLVPGDTNGQQDVFLIDRGILSGTVDISIEP